MKDFKPQTTKGSDKMFTGDVYITTLLNGTGPSKVNMASVHFTPGAHSAWHSHPVGQYLHVVEGTGLLQERGGEVRVLKAGDTVYTEPNVEHWHGASPDSFMMHLALWEGSEMNWLEHVTDEEYNSRTNK